MEFKPNKTRKFLVKNKWFLLFIALAFHFTIAKYWISVHTVTDKLIKEPTIAKTILISSSFLCKFLFAYGFIFCLITAQLLILIKWSLSRKRTLFKHKHELIVKRKLKRLWNFSLLAFVLFYLLTIASWSIS